MTIHIDAHTSALHDLRTLTKIIENMSEKYGSNEVRTSVESIINDVERKQKDTNENNQEF